jgi:hypothetical protein
MLIKPSLCSKAGHFITDWFLFEIGYLCGLAFANIETSEKKPRLLANRNHGNVNQAEQCAGKSQPAYFSLPPHRHRTQAYKTEQGNQFGNNPSVLGGQPVALKNQTDTAQQQQRIQEVRSDPQAFATQHFRLEFGKKNPADKTDDNKNNQGQMQIFKHDTSAIGG